MFIIDYEEKGYNISGYDESGYEGSGYDESGYEELELNTNHTEINNKPIDNSKLYIILLISIGVICCFPIFAGFMNVLYNGTKNCLNISVNKTKKIYYWIRNYSMKICDCYPKNIYMLNENNIVELNNKFVDNNTCSICIDEINKKKITLKKCNHTFHKNCILQWIRSNYENNIIPCCPVCRNNIYDNEDLYTILNKLHDYNIISIPDNSNNNYSISIDYSSDSSTYSDYA